MSDDSASALDALEVTEETTAAEGYDRWRILIDGWVLTPARIVWDDRRTRYGSVIIAAYLLVGIFGPIVLNAPVKNEAGAYVGLFENLAYPLGTNGDGTDLLSKTVYATPFMLKLAFAGGVVTTGLGAFVGTVAGFSGGRLERILLTASDIQIAIPGLPLIIVLALVIEPRDAFVLGFLLSIDAWAGMARQLHSQVLAIRSETYVEASKMMDIGPLTIIRDDILPNVMPYIMINFMGNTTRVINASVGLYFIGVLPFSAPNWGVMLNQSYQSGALLSADAVHTILVPVFAIAVLGYGITIFSQGMDRLFNPRVRAKHADTASEDVVAEGP
jgi:peptide/nickel transport system permease protein